VRVSLVSFREQVADALGELSSEMRRVMDWLEHDRPRYWKTQTRRAMDVEHEAKQALHRCLMFPIADERPSCYEERNELKKAQAHLKYCQDKIDRVRHWQSSFQHELFEYDGRISQLVRLVEVEIPKSIAVLEKVLRHLEEYQSVRVVNPRSAYDDVAMARAIWTEAEAGVKQSVADEGESSSGERDSADTAESGTIANDDPPSAAAAASNARQ